MTRRRRPHVLLAVAATGTLLAGLTSCSSGGQDAAPPPTTTAPPFTVPPAPTTTVAPPDAPLVFSPEGNNLWAYADADGFPSQEVATNAEDDPDGRDINGQVCLLPGGLLVAGEDTGQPDVTPGWGVFQLEGDQLGELSVDQVGKLTPTYQSHPDNFGCAVLSTGALVTTDIGNEVTGPADGQLTVWFPPFTGGTLDPEAPNAGFTAVAHCKVDIGLATPGGIAVDGDDDVYVGSARPPTAGVLRFSGDWPTGPDAAGGCGRTDPTGEPLVDEGAVEREVFIPAGPHRLVAPHSVALTAEGGFYVSSVVNGIINEYDADGTFVQRVLAPPAGEELGAEPFSTGTPLGLATAPDGSLFYADLGLVADPESGFGPGDHTGSVRVIRIVDGEPQSPEVVADDLDFPDGLGVFPAGGAGGVASVL